ncbi:MAG: DMT family transporter [Xanthomonadales bacterium]|nr:DMT family transporter [Xanthomonadales bacterium]
MSTRPSEGPAIDSIVQASQSAAAGQRPGGNAAGMAAIGLWSTLAVLATWTGSIPPLQLLAACFVTAGVVGLVLPLWRRPAGQSWRQSLRQPWRAYVLTTAALFGYHALYFLALKTAPPVEASLINYLWPLLIVLVAACLPGTRPPPAVYVAVALGFVGAVAVVTRMRRPELEPAHALGYLAALGAALVWAAYSVLNRRHAGIPSTALALPCLTVALLASLGHGLLETTAWPEPGEWLAILALGLGPVGGAFWLWDHGTKHGQLAVLGTLAYAAPVLSTLWLLLAGRAEPHWSQALACVLIVGAGLLLRRVMRGQAG